MNEEKILYLKEDIHTALKEAQGGVPRNVWETISAFANTSGGSIYFGVKEGKEKNEILGVENPEDMIRDLLSTERAGKLSYPIFREEDFSLLVLQGRKILALHIPEANRTIKPVYLDGQLEKSFLRVGEGDQHLNGGELKYFLFDNGEESYDLRPNPMGFGFSSVNKETLAAYRKEMDYYNPKNIYKSLGDEDFLRSIGCLRKDNRGEAVLTLAALMMFTNAPLIEQVFPKYALDYREAETPSSKWNDRIFSQDDTWSGNLFDFYLLLMEKMKNALPKPYVIEEDKDVGRTLMEEVLRESLCNAFTNYSPFLAGGILFLRQQDGYTVRNAGRLKVGLEQALRGGISDPRNRSIMSLFRHLGISDAGGTGITNIFSKCHRCSLPDSVLSEDDSQNQTTLVISYHSNLPELNEDEKEVYLAIQKRGENGAGLLDVLPEVAFGRTKLSSLLNSMESKGLLITNGAKRKGKLYFLKK